MPKDKFDAIGPMLGAIGEEVAHELGGNPDGIYLYVEVGDNWISVNVFRDDGDVVRNYDHDDDLTELIWDVWAAEDADKRWCVMEYEIQGTRFDVSFKFPDEVDVESMEVDRREIALKQRYGDKPVVYPPIPEHLLKLQRD